MAKTDENKNEYKEKKNETYKYRYGECHNCKNEITFNIPQGRPAAEFMNEFINNDNICPLCRCKLTN